MNPWLVMVLGMCTVFTGLIALILLTKLMSALFARTKKPDAAKSPAFEQQATVPAPLAIADRRAFDAAVAAAIATYLGTDVSGLRIHSVRQLSAGQDRKAFIGAIAASIATYMDKDVKALRIKSIKQI